MIKIAFFMQQMLAGGIENALIHFINALPKDQYDCTIFVISRTGEFLQKAEELCSIKEIPMSDPMRAQIPVGGIRIATKWALRQKMVWRALRLALSYGLGNRAFAELNVDFDKIPELAETFDVAVCYQLHSPFLVRYVAEKVNAPQKVGWMHNDFATTGYQIVELKRYLDRYHFFFGNAKQIVNEFTGIFPSYESKTKVIYSVLDTREIMQRVQTGQAEGFAEDESKLKILTIGRLENQKAIDWAAEACENLLMGSHPDFCWYVIGDGSEREKLRKRIGKLKIQNHFILLGSRSNPYPYYRQCDIYVQTSRHEGYATTITEAALFHKPIVTTDVSGVSEQLENGVTGIVTGFSPQHIADGIRQAFDPVKRQALSAALREKEHVRQNAVLLFEETLGFTSTSVHAQQS